MRKNSANSYKLRGQALEQLANISDDGRGNEQTKTKKVGGYKWCFHCDNVLEIVSCYHINFESSHFIFVVKDWGNWSIQNNIGLATESNGFNFEGSRAHARFTHRGSGKNQVCNLLWEFRYSESILRYRSLLTAIYYLNFIRYWVEQGAKNFPKNKSVNRLRVKMEDARNLMEAGTGASSVVTRYLI